MSIHAKTIDRVSISGRLSDRRLTRLPSLIRRCERDGRLREIVRDAIRDTEAEETAHLTRDFRPGIGSGRAAHWYLWTYRRLAVVAEAIHRSAGLTGRVVSQIARWLVTADSLSDYDTRPDLPAVPDSVALVPAEHYGWITTAHGRRWHEWMTAIGRPAIAAAEGAAEVAACEADPSYTISGYLAESILAWRGETGHHSYHGCAGNESYVWHRDHSEHWDLLMSHAPRGASGDGWEQVYPHERDRAEACRARGWMHTLRVSDSVYTERTL